MAFEECFKGKTILVTGAGRGIGKAVCIKLHSLGANIWAVSKNPDNLVQLKFACPGIETVAVDLGDWKATREAIEKIPVVFDCLLNNAGVCPTGYFMDAKEEDFDVIFAVNLKSVANVTQVVAQRMIDNGTGGSIVNVSSVGGLRASPTLAAYSSLKAGLGHLTKIMAIELGPKKIRVNSVNPAGVETDMLASLISNLKEELDLKAYLERIPLRRPVVAMDEVVNGILFYLSDLVPIVTGTHLPLDGGWSIN